MDTAHIYVYGVIDFWQDEHASEWGYVNLKDVKNQYETQKSAKEIKVHIHSEGGVVTEGFAIHDYLRSLGKPITTIIEGTCASIATVIALAGDKRVMTSNSNFFIHNPWGFAGGDKDQIQKYANELERLEGEIAEFYDSKTNISKEEALELMKVETTFTAEEALGKGFITEIATVMKAVALYKPKSKKMADKALTKTEAESIMDKAVNTISKLFNSKPKNKIVQDANGTEIDFPDLSEDDTPSIGDSATVDGSPADGEMIMPSGETYVFESGELRDVQTEAEEPEEETQALRDEIQNLKSKLSRKDEKVKALKNENQKLKENEEKNNKALKDLKEDILNVKRSIGSDFKHEDKQQNHKEGNKTRSVWKEQE